VVQAAPKAPEHPPPSMVWYRSSALTLMVASKVRGAGLWGGPHALAVTALVRAVNMREDFILTLSLPRNTANERGYKET
jgi:hypothetical protein